jgi:tripartite-type tricarboxylate transporter receptor subunit TctC
MRTAAFAAAVAMMSPALETLAQTYPSKPVRVIVPFGAGGPADVYARALAQHMSETLKQSFVVENRPGAGAIIGTDAVAKSAPDGYTLLLMSNTHTTNESLIPNKPFQLMRDFVPVTPINYSDLLMVAHPSTGVKNLKEFIALAKSKPGALNYASSGPGTPYHMAGELFKAMTGTDIVHVPHKTSGDMRSSVIGGHVQMMRGCITVWRRACARPAIVPAPPATAVTPDIPTVAEAGVPGYDDNLARPDGKGTPKEVVDKLNAEISKVIARADVKKMWGEQGAVPMTMTPAEFDKYLRADIEKWAHVVKVSGAKVE